MTSQSELTVFLATLLVHLLYDFHLQGPYISEQKCENRSLMLVHALTWALSISAVLWFFRCGSLGKLVFLFLSHYILDACKCAGVIDPCGDQLGHVATLFVCVL